jgi:hypothetical protein
VAPVLHPVLAVQVVILFSQQLQQPVVARAAVAVGLLRVVMAVLVAAVVMAALVELEILHLRLLLKAVMVAADQTAPQIMVAAAVAVHLPQVRMAHQLLAATAAQVRPQAFLAAASPMQVVEAAQQPMAARLELAVPAAVVTEKMLLRRAMLVQPIPEVAAVVVV